MKNTLTLFVLLLFCHFQMAFGQCPGSVLLTCQDEVDNFDCTEIIGTLTIFGEDISDLNGLSELQSITGTLQIVATSLEDLNGLNNLTNIGGYFRIESNDLLTNLNALTNLQDIGTFIFDPESGIPFSMSINNNPELLDISGIYQVEVDNGISDVQMEIENNCCEVLESLNVNIGRTSSYFIFQGAQGSPCEDANLFCENSTLSSCSGTITLFSQAAVNNFSGCSTIEGTLIIGGDEDNISDISDLSPLSNISTITGSLLINEASQLNSLQGLNNLTNVGGYLGVYKSGITTLNGLGNLTSIGGLIIDETSLTSLDGLDILAEIDDIITIEGNENLENIDALNQISTINSTLKIDDNNSLTNINGLNGLNEIGGSLFIGDDGDGNDLLTNLDGLSNLTSIGYDINITDNDNLNSISGLQNLEFIGGEEVNIFNPNVTDCCAIENAISNIGCDIDISVACFNSCIQSTSGVPRRAYFRDADGDGFGDSFSGLGDYIISCTPVGGGYVDNDDDIDDSDPYTYPNAPERCDCVDNDNNGQVDEGTGFYPDMDGDGYGDTNAPMAPNCIEGYVNDNTDCNDNNPDIYPGQPDYVNGDGIDNDCDGLIDEDPNGNNLSTWYFDGDNDGFGDPNNSEENMTQLPGYVLNNDDCDDTNPSINPDAVEICDGIDNNCDNDIDEGVTTAFYPDMDMDGFGDENAAATLACDAPPNFVDNNDDCDDGDDSITTGCGACPSNISFFSQADIDNFPIEYPNCTEISDTVRIRTPFGSIAGITNLDGLNQITSIGDLYIFNNPLLEDLSGLSNLTSIEREFILADNNLITNLNGLDNLNFIGTNFEVRNNNSLANFSGLDNLDTIAIAFQIFENPLLTSISSLQGINYVRSIVWGSNSSLVDIDIFENVHSFPGGLFLFNNSSLNDLSSFITIDTTNVLLIQDNNGLSNLEGLENLRYIQSELTISSNSVLNSLSSLSNLDWVGSSISVSQNNELTSLSGLENINPNSFNSLTIQSSNNLSICNVQSICDYLSNGGTASISNNTGDCANLMAVENACGITPPPPCPTGDIEFNSQAEVDAFPANCNSIDGNLIISGIDITDLSNLSGITQVTGDVFIQNNPFLDNLDGLDGLTNIGGCLHLLDNDLLENINGLINVVFIGTDIFIENNPFLINIDGLGSLTIINGGFHLINLPALQNVDGISGVLEITLQLIIDNCPVLSNLNGFQFVTFIGGNIQVSNCILISDLSGFSGLIIIGGDIRIQGNGGIINLQGLDNVISIGGDFYITDVPDLNSLQILINLEFIGGCFHLQNLDNLTSLDGLQNLTSIGTDLFIVGNINLSECCAIYDLLNNNGVGGNITINGNPIGCNSVADILVECCPSIFDPVCADGTTFDNACEAEEAGFFDYTPGPCPIGPTDCDNIVIDTTGGMLNITGMDLAPSSFVQVFDASFNTLFQCFDDCDGAISLDYGNGTFYVLAKYLNENFETDCEIFETIEISDSPGPVTPNSFCGGVTYDIQPNQLNVVGLDASLLTEIQIFDLAWNDVFSCFNDCGTPPAIPLQAGGYQVLFKYFNQDYTVECEVLDTVYISNNLLVGESDFNFEVTKYDEHTELLWLHQNDGNTIEYMVQKADENSEFKTTETIPAEAHNNELFRAYDLQPFEGKNYYRIGLRQNIGEILYSEIKEINFPVLPRYTIFPNPAKEFAKIDLSRSIGRQAELIINNNLGQPIKQFSIDNIASKYFQMDLRELREGYYWIWVNIEGRRAIAVPLMIGK